MSAITPCLWFDDQGEEAATFYVSLFPDSSITDVTRWTADANPDRAGQVLTVELVLDGRPYTFLNGGPDFTLDEAFSFQVACADQAEVDRYWEAFTADGGEESQCGWCKDRFGVSWQVVPDALPRLLADPDPARAARAMQAMFGMRKLVVADLESAAAG
jgi:predicted 3-demethylubiquinone-9 3-methyltransferase (glyoxalase superfamily)